LTHSHVNGRLARLHLRNVVSQQFPGHRDVKATEIDVKATEIASMKRAVVAAGEVARCCHDRISRRETGFRAAAVVVQGYG